VARFTPATLSSFLALKFSLTLQLKGLSGPNKSYNTRKEKDMSKAGSVFLDTNDVFPELELQLASGETMKLPEGTGEGYGVLLFYRGYW